MAALALPALAACTDNTTDHRPPAATGTITRHARRTTRATCPPTRRPRATSSSRSRTRAARSPSSTCYGEDGLRIVGEVENIGPGLSRDLVVTCPAGKYVTACKPGMNGDGIRSDFTVTDSGEEERGRGCRPAAASSDRQRAVRRYVEDQTEQLLAGTKAFAAAYKAGDDDEGPRALRRRPACTGSASSRSPSPSATSTRRWTSARPTSSRARSGPAGTGSRRTCGRRRAGYTALTARPSGRRTPTTCWPTPRRSTSGSQTLDFTVDQIGNGAKGLLDEVATGKVTGEEEIWSHTDLYDFQANVDGARVAFEGLQPVLRAEGPGARRSRSSSASPRCRAARPAQDGRRVRLLRPADRGAGQAALRRRQRAVRAAVAS